IFDPRYERNPEREMLDRYRQIFESDGTGKALGVKFRLDIPKSWVIKEGKRPHIHAIATSELGRGLESFIVDVREIDLQGDGPISLEEVNSFIKDGCVRDFLPQRAVYIDSGAMEIEHLPGYWNRFDLAVE